MRNTRKEDKNELIVQTISQKRTVFNENGTRIFAKTHTVQPLLALALHTTSNWRKAQRRLAPLATANLKLV
jgi:hypothetical protein